MTDKTSKWETCQMTAPETIHVWTHVPKGHNPNGIAGFGIRDEPFVMPPPGGRVWIATDEIEEVENTFGIVDEPDVSYTRTDIAEVRIAQLEAECSALQANLDSLMLEYCPGDMSEEQYANWAKHQVRSTDD